MSLYPDPLPDETCEEWQNRTGEGCVRHCHMCNPVPCGHAGVAAVSGHYVDPNGVVDDCVEDYCVACTKVMAGFIPSRDAWRCDLGNHVCGPSDELVWCDCDDEEADDDRGFCRTCYDAGTHDEDCCGMDDDSAALEDVRP